MYPKPYVVVINNFLNNPHQIRADILESSFDQYAQNGFHRRIAKPQKGFQAIRNKICNRLNISSLTFLESQTISYTERDESENKLAGVWIHSDRCRWVCLLFLTPNAPINSGISFYRHIKSGFFRWEEVENCNQPIATEVAGTISQDSANLDAWRELFQVGNIFNRMVAFDSRIFHQATSYFGKDLQTSRLTLNFYFK